jgi:hypothetical protein
MAKANKEAPAEEVTNGLVETVEETVATVEQATPEVFLNQAPVEREDPGNKTRAYRG